MAKDGGYCARKHCPRQVVGSRGGVLTCFYEAVLQELIACNRSLGIHREQTTTMTVLQHRDNHMHPIAVVAGLE